MSVVIEHVRHRVGVVVLSHWDPLMRTACGRRFLGTTLSTRDTRHHEPATSRCGGCWA